MMKSSKNTAAPVVRVANKAILALAAVSGLALAGCHQDMWNQPRFSSLQKNEFFVDEAASRLPVENTVAYDGARREWINNVYAEMTGEKLVPSVMDDTFWTGVNEDGTFLADNYFPVTMALLERGQERYNAICSHCHDEAGNGNGVITQRGFPLATSYHIDRLREVEDGYIFDVIRNGFGRMYSYGARVSAEDRWAIVAYIRAIQYSQNVPTGDLTEEDQQGLQAALHPEPEAADQDVDEANAH